MPWGNLMHVLEHGGDRDRLQLRRAGCADEVARAQAFVDSLPLDTARGCTSTRG